MVHTEYLAKKDIPLGHFTIKKGDTMTCFQRPSGGFTLWHHTGVWRLSKEYVGKKVDKEKKVEHETIR